MRKAQLAPQTTQTPCGLPLTEIDTVLVENWDQCLLDRPDVFSHGAAGATVLTSLEFARILPDVLFRLR